MECRERAMICFSPERSGNLQSYIKIFRMKNIQQIARKSSALPFEKPAIFK